MRRSIHAPKDYKEINATAPNNIGRRVVALNQWRLANYKPPQSIDPRTSFALTKRNDLGLGKKYKKRCGLH
jgi:hypothetical protein